MSYIFDIEMFMNHDLLKSIIYDQHEIIKNFQIIPSDSWLEMVDYNRANACKIFLGVGMVFVGQEVVALPGD